mmetsp:Transcript_720/g.996  ORF Transcript_720/g.996 Transcript_720/m.996 type:complete len:116 (-) Transcript_720:259-606(-)
MICAIYRSADCLEVLFKYGGIKTDLLDNNGKYAIQLAEYYGSIDCFEILKEIPLGLVEINQMYLQQDRIFNFENDPKYQELLMNGIARPCIYCESNLGYIRYSTCCGAPMHQECL